MTAKITIPRGSVEYVQATVTSDVTLSTQVVEIAIATGTPSTWLPGTWLGSADTTRSVRTTSAVTFSTGNYPAKTHFVYVRVTDSPEIPIMLAGQLTIAG